MLLGRCLLILIWIICYTRWTLLRMNSCSLKTANRILGRIAGLCSIRIRALIEESIHGQLALNRSGAAFLLGFDRQCLKFSAGRSLPIDVGWNFTALTTLECLYNILDGIFIEVRQKEMDIVQNVIHLNVHLHRGPHHAPKKLRNIGRIAGMLKGHHRFRTGTIPTCR